VFAYVQTRTAERGYSAMSNFSIAFLYELSSINSMRFLFIEDNYLRCRYYVQPVNMSHPRKEILLCSCRKLGSSNLNQICDKDAINMLSI